MIVTFTLVAAVLADMVPAPQIRSIGLAEAVQAARQHQPQLLQAHALSDAARARIDIQRAPLLPQLLGTASYQRTTANYVFRPGTTPNIMVPGPSGDTFNFWSFGATLSQYIYDFGQTGGRWKAAKETAEAQVATEKATELQIELTARNAYFQARAQKALLQVAKESLTNQDRHLSQVQGFVKAGTRPEIDLAQARTDRANAQVQLVTTENNYEIAKAQLNQAMGIDGDTHYEVRDETLGEIHGEEEPRQNLVDEALKSRPDLFSLDRQIAAQKSTIRSIKGGYGPSIAAAMSITDQGVDISALTWNWNATVNLTWSIFSGLLTLSQTKEAQANLIAVSAQKETLRQQVNVDVDQARLQVRGAKSALYAAGEALINAKERLRLAEARYAAGVGSIIELGDAQVASTTAAAQLVQSEYNLSSARAMFLKAVGRVE